MNGERVGRRLGVDDAQIEAVGAGAEIDAGRAAIIGDDNMVGAFRVLTLVAVTIAGGAETSDTVSSPTPVVTPMNSMSVCSVVKAIGGALGERSTLNIARPPCCVAEPRLPT